MLPITHSEFTCSLCTAYPAIIFPVIIWTQNFTTFHVHFGCVHLKQIDFASGNCTMASENIDMITKRPRTPHDQYTCMTEEQIHNNTINGVSRIYKLACIRHLSQWGISQLWGYIYICVCERKMQADNDMREEGFCQGYSLHNEMCICFQ